MSIKEEQLNTRAGFKQEMQTRHIVMLALGGVIGTGLFLTSGYTVNQAGPLGAVIAYIIGALMVYMVMMCLGELAVQMPETGSFSTYATRFLGPGTGYTVAWLYWLTWTVAIGSEFTAAGILMARWFPDTPVWIWSALFAGVVFLTNVISVRLFAETEFWLSLIKVVTVVVFLMIGGGAILGLLHIDQAHSIGLGNFTREGLFPTGFMPIAMTLLAVSFAFSGTELIGIAAGETKDPQRNVPRAIRTTVLRLAIFFVGTIFVLATLLPREQAGLVESPFVTVFTYIGIPYSADIMNFVIITALLSAANSGLYAASRMLWTLSDQGHLPKQFSSLTRMGTPLNAIVVEHGRRRRLVAQQRVCRRHRLPGAGVDFRVGGGGGVDEHRREPDRFPPSLRGQWRRCPRPQVPRPGLSVGATGGAGVLQPGVCGDRFRP